MPANLPPQYHDAEDRFRQASTTEEKIAALEEMLRIMPKHKGTSKLQADVKARIAKLRRQPKSTGPTRAGGPVIPREGAGQVALVGPANSGKSSLVGRLTHATPEVADYPYTTREPIPGMMPFEDIAFQLIDLPPLWDQHVEPWYFDLVRRAESGRYNQLEVSRGVPIQMLERYFEHAAGSWKVKPAIRGQIGFRALSLIQPWPELPTFDLVLLQDVLIHFAEDVQRRILEQLQACVRTGGYLLLGAELQVLRDAGWEQIALGRTCAYRRAA